MNLGKFSILNGWYQGGFGGGGEKEERELERERRGGTDTHSLEINKSQSAKQNIRPAAKMIPRLLNNEKKTLIFALAFREAITG